MLHNRISTVANNTVHAGLQLVSVMADEILCQVNNIIKSEEDERSYRALQLNNLMKVLLISDPKTDKSAAALDVHVGFMCDPADLPGLAHFCEHMLFLGTEKYPSENEYNRYLSEHGGYGNACTAADHTTYFFEVTPEHLPNALDRFAQFFLCPLFTESASDREVNAVNSEHENNIQCDGWRIEQVIKSTSNPDHAYCKFGTGSKETLDVIPKSKGVIIRDELLKFHSKWYSSNVMALSVFGKETLDELQNMVVNLFSDVVNKNVTIPEWSEHPFGPNELKRQAYVVPVQDYRELKITFPIPDLHAFYKTDPENYLGDLIGHEGPGSLLSTLKLKGWVNTLMSGLSDGAKGFSFFKVTTDLTEDGIEHVDDIVTLVFEYIQMLRKEGPQEWFFRECQHLSSMEFRFKDKESPDTLACYTVSCLHDYPLEEILSGPYLMDEYRPDLIDMVLSKLTPDAVQLTVVGKKFEGQTDAIEPWYGTHYTMKPIPESVINKWRNVGTNDNLHLPPRNEFIPTNFELMQGEEDASKLPMLIKDTNLTRVWFKQDHEFLLPKAVLNFQLISPMAYLDPLHCNYSCLFVQLFEDELNEYAYAAELTGLGYWFSNTSYGITLGVSGFSDKQRVLLEKIMDKLITFKVEPKRFEIIRERHVRTLRNFYSEQPYQHASYYVSALLDERQWTNDELLSSTEEITLKGLQDFIPKLLAKFHIDSLIHGNITKQQALGLVSIVENGLQERADTKPLLRSQLLKDREIQLSANSNFLMKRTNSVHSASCAEVYYQYSLHETRANVLLQLFCQLIREPCFDMLRTKEQLGYIVWSEIWCGNSVQGFYVAVQADRNPKYIDGRIEAFLLTMDVYLHEISEEEFERHKEALIANRLEKPKQLCSQTAQYWDEIVSQQYNFDRDNVEVSVLRTLTKDDIINLYKKHFAHDAPSRNKMAVHIFNPNSSDNEDAVKNQCLDGFTPAPLISEPTMIEDITEFKSTMSLWPLIPPYNPISSFLTEAKSKL